MAQGKAATSPISDVLFWGLMCALVVGALAAGMAFAVGEISNAGWLAGGALGGLAFVVGTYIMARTVTSATLPPPNTLKAPTAPPGGAFRMPGAPAPTARSAAPAEPAPAPSLSEMGEAAGEAVSKAAYSASAAVTSAAQAARDAIAGVLDTAPERDEPARNAVEPVRPTSLDGPRDGGADDLKKIKGVGPKLEELLHSLGFYHFDQIAAWGPAEIAWVDSNLEGFNGRATRDEWVAQARLLAAGGETEFSQRVDKGDVY